MRIYLAARYSRRLELCRYRAEFTMAGFLINGRWLDGSHRLSDVGVPIGDDFETLVESGACQRAAELRLKFATDDYEDVINSDALVAFTEAPRTANSRGGRHVELGIALGRRMPVVVVGPRENIFCWLPDVRSQFDAWPGVEPIVSALTSAGAS